MIYFLVSFMCAGAINGQETHQDLEDSEPRLKHHLILAFDRSGSVRKKVRKDVVKSVITNALYLKKTITCP